MAELEWLTYDQFAAHLGETFHVGVEGGSTTVEMVLAEATEGAELGGPGPDGQQRRQFSLVFHGSATPHLPQGTYLVRHREMGAFALFLVPIGPEGDELQYEAAFA